MTTKCQYNSCLNTASYNVFIADQQQNKKLCAECIKYFSKCHGCDNLSERDCCEHCIIKGPAPSKTYSFDPVITNKLMRAHDRLVRKGRW